MHAYIHNCMLVSPSLSFSLSLSLSLSPCLFIHPALPPSLSLPPSASLSLYLRPSCPRKDERSLTANSPSTGLGPAGLVQEGTALGAPARGPVDHREGKLQDFCNTGKTGGRILIQDACLKPVCNILKCVLRIHCLLLGALQSSSIVSFRISGPLCLRCLCPGRTKLYLASGPKVLHFQDLRFRLHYT